MYILWTEGEKNVEKALNYATSWCTLRVRDGRAVCPECGRITGQRIRQDTVLVKFPLYCKHCRREIIVNTEEPEPDAVPLSQTQSQSRS